MTPIDLEGLRALLAGKRHDAYVEVFAPQLRALLAQAERAQTDRAEVARLTDAWHQDHQEVEAQAEEIARLRPLAEAVKAWDLRGSTHWSTRDGPLEAALTAYETALRSAAQPAAEPWQPIETAPDDGRKVWVFGGRHEKPHLTEADGAWWRHAASTGSKAIATHWMEFEPPAPPAAAAERGEDSNGQ